MTSDELVAWRKTRAWTQRQAAQWFNCTVTAWSNWENDRRPVPSKLIQRIAEESVHV